MKLPLIIILSLGAVSCATKPKLEPDRVLDHYHNPVYSNAKIVAIGGKRFKYPAWIDKCQVTTALRGHGVKSLIASENIIETDTVWLRQETSIRIVQSLTTHKTYIIWRNPLSTLEWLLDGDSTLSDLDRLRNYKLGYMIDLADEEFLILTSFEGQVTTLVNMNGDVVGYGQSSYGAYKIFTSCYNKIKNGEPI